VVGQQRLQLGDQPAMPTTPVGGARCLALAHYVRALPDSALNNLLRGLPRKQFDRLVDAAYRPEGSAA
jgi:hypothetical protein